MILVLFLFSCVYFCSCNHCLNPSVSEGIHLVRDQIYRNSTQDELLTIASTYFGHDQFFNFLKQKSNYSDYSQCESDILRLYGDDTITG